MSLRITCGAKTSTAAEGFLRGPHGPDVRSLQLEAEREHFPRVFIVLYDQHTHAVEAKPHGHGGCSCKSRATS